MAILTLLLAVSLAAQRDEGGTFIVVSITAFNQFTFDVKLKNPRTGYVHSVTVSVDIARLIRIGDRVRKRNEGGEVILTPVRVPAEPRREDPPPRRPTPLPWELPAEAAEPEKPKKPAPCAKWPCNARAPAFSGEGSTIGKPLDLTKVAATATVRVQSIRFVYDDQAGRPSLGKCDALTSGSFTAGGFAPMVLLKIDGTTQNPRYADKSEFPFHGFDPPGPTTHYRGGIALDANGIPRIFRQSGVLRDDLGQGVSVMGGGALVLHGGRRVHERDLCCCQGFVDSFKGDGPRTLDWSKCGFASAQLRVSPHHIVVASKGNDVYVLAVPSTGAGIQSQLFAAGFENAVILDGGAGAFMLARGHGVIFDGYRPKDPDGPRGTNSMRLCIQGTVAKYEPPKAPPRRK